MTSISSAGNLSQLPRKGWATEGDQKGNWACSLLGFFPQVISRHPHKTAMVAPRNDDRAGCFSRPKQVHTPSAKASFCSLTLPPPYTCLLSSSQCQLQENQAAQALECFSKGQLLAFGVGQFFVIQDSPTHHRTFSIPGPCLLNASSGCQPSYCTPTSISQVHQLWR